MPPDPFLLTDIAHLVTPIGPGPHHGVAMRNVHRIDQAAIEITGNRITWLGPAADYRGAATEIRPLGGRVVTPALVDPHTHVVWAGDRLADFEARVSGVPYETILAGGGGIRSTMRHTAQATAAELVDLARPRVAALQRSGAATIEVKSGYGGTVATELTSLEAIAALRQQVAPTIVATLLIHVPPAAREARESFLHEVTTTLIPQVAARGLAQAVDIFIEREAFTPDEAARIFTAATEHGLPVKAHVDQFHAIGGLECAIAHGALSVDHLEASGPAQIAALAASRTIGVILPGVTLHLGLPAAPGRALIDAGAAVAIGTDLNPGSSPLFSTQLALALAVRLNGLTPAEALTGATANAAAALGLHDRGYLAEGARADLLVLDATDWRDLAYTLGSSPVHSLFIAGHEIS